MTTIEARIEQGMALLDEKKPGWREKIDLDTLDLQLTEKCIIGQVFDVFYVGEYENALEWLRIDDADYGFALTEREWLGEDINYVMLTDAWKLALSA